MVWTEFLWTLVSGWEDDQGQDVRFNQTWSVLKVKARCWLRLWVDLNEFYKLSTEPSHNVPTFPLAHTRAPFFCTDLRWTSQTLTVSSRRLFLRLEVFPAHGWRQAVKIGTQVMSRMCDGQFLCVCTAVAPDGSLNKLLAHYLKTGFIGLIDTYINYSWLLA